VRLSSSLTYLPSAPRLVPPSTARDRPNVTVIVLILVGFAAAGVVLLTNRAAVMEAGFSWRFTNEQLVKSPLYYYAHATQVAALTIAGIVALMSRVRSVPKRIVLAFGGLQLAGLVMAFRGLDLDDFLTTRIFASTGPFVTVISALAFVTIRRRDFEVLERAVVLLAALVSAAVLYAGASLESIDRDEVVKSLQGFLNVLYWMAVWLVVRPPGRRLWGRVLRWVPLLVYGAGSVLTQTRLNFVMLLLAVVAHVYVSARRTGRRLSAVGGVLAAAVLVMTAAIFVAGTSTASMFGGAFSGIRDRIGDDTRSGQIVMFFENVAPWELVFGRGSRATWNWPGMSAIWAGGTDIGYLSLLFFGGVPLLVAYLLFHVVPAWRIIRSPRAHVALGPAVMVMLWAVRMVSSSFPSLSLEYYPVLLFVGACIGSEAYREEGRARTRLEPNTVVLAESSSLDRVSTLRADEARA
jgi:hypothetical protein